MGFSMVTYVASAGGFAYILQGGSKTTDTGTDPEVTAIVNSFRLLTPKSPSSRKPIAPANRLGFSVTTAFTIILMGAVLVYIFNTRKTKRP
jgi:hypothetical protein